MIHGWSQHFDCLQCFDIFDEREGHSACITPNNLQTFCFAGVSQNRKDGCPNKNYYWMCVCVWCSQFVLSKEQATESVDISRQSRKVCILVLDQMMHHRQHHWVDQEQFHLAFISHCYTATIQLLWVTSVTWLWMHARNVRISVSTCNTMATSLAGSNILASQQLSLHLNNNFSRILCVHSFLG